jgi:carrier protein
MNLLFLNIWNECNILFCYSGIFSSIREIFHENGILGFFSGIVPRILGEIGSAVIASSLTFIVKSYLMNDRDLKKFTAASMAVSTCFYQVVKS